MWLLLFALLLLLFVFAGLAVFVARLFLVALLALLILGLLGGWGWRRGRSQGGG